MLLSNLSAHLRLNLNFLFKLIWDETKSSAYLPYLLIFPYPLSLIFLASHTSSVVSKIIIKCCFLFSPVDATILVTYVLCHKRSNVLIINTCMHWATRFVTLHSVQDVCRKWSTTLGLACVCDGLEIPELRYVMSSKVALMVTTSCNWW